PLDAVLINPGRLDMTFNGPSIAQAVNSHSQQALLYDFTLQPRNVHWTVTESTFASGGSGTDLPAHIQMALHRDSNGNGVFDPAIDQRATSGTVGSFPSDDGNYVATLVNQQFLIGQPRRYFLVGRMNGTAVSGQTFNATLTNVAAVPAST